VLCTGHGHGPCFVYWECRWGTSRTDSRK
jgi:hypothetical protein